MAHSHDDSQDPCCSQTNYGVAQTLDEMEFERGIWQAAMDGDEKRVETLLIKNCKVNMVDSAGYTALHYAARNGHYRVSKILLRHGADVNTVTPHIRATPLHRAAAQGHFKVVHTLLHHGADANMTDVDGKTALHRAIPTLPNSSKGADVCKMLIPVTDLTIKDKNGNTPEELYKQYEKRCNSKITDTFAKTFEDAKKFLRFEDNEALKAFLYAPVEGTKTVSKIEEEKKETIEKSKQNKKILNTKTLEEEIKNLSLEEEILKRRNLKTEKNVDGMKQKIQDVTETVSKIEEEEKETIEKSKKNKKILNTKTLEEEIKNLSYLSYLEEEILRRRNLNILAEMSMVKKEEEKSKKVKKISLEEYRKRRAQRVTESVRKTENDDKVKIFSIVSKKATETVKMEGEKEKREEKSKKDEKISLKSFDVNQTKDIVSQSNRDEKVKTISRQTLLAKLNKEMEKMKEEMKIEEKKEEREEKSKKDTMTPSLDVVEVLQNLRHYKITKGMLKQKEKGGEEKSKKDEKILNTKTLEESVEEEIKNLSLEEEIKNLSLEEEILRRRNLKTEKNVDGMKQKIQDVIETISKIEVEKKETIEKSKKISKEINEVKQKILKISEKLTKVEKKVNDEKVKIVPKEATETEKMEEESEEKSKKDEKILYTSLEEDIKTLEKDVNEMKQNIQEITEFNELLADTEFDNILAEMSMEKEEEEEEKSKKDKKISNTALEKDIKTFEKDVNEMKQKIQEVTERVRKTENDDKVKIFSIVSKKATKTVKMEGEKEEREEKSKKDEKISFKSFDVNQTKDTLSQSNRDEEKIKGKKEERKEKSKEDTIISSFTKNIKFNNLREILGDTEFYNIVMEISKEKEKEKEEKKSKKDTMTPSLDVLQNLRHYKITKRMLKQKEKGGEEKSKKDEKISLKSFNVNETKDTVSQGNTDEEVKTILYQRPLIKSKKEMEKIQEEMKMEEDKEKKEKSKEDTMISSLEVKFNEILENLQYHNTAMETLKQKEKEKGEKKNKKDKNKKSKKDKNKKSKKK